MQSPCIWRFRVICLRDCLRKRVMYVSGKKPVSRMHRPLALLVAWVFAAFGVIAPLHHAGMHVAASPSASFSASCDDAFSVTDPHPAVSEESSNRERNAAHLETGSAAPASDCPLCAFAAQLVSPAVSVSLPGLHPLLIAAPAPLASLEEAPVSDLLSLYQSRAPPAAV